MEQMIDLHSHILPYLDDGAASLEQSLEMARQAVLNGIQTIIATPHHGNGIHWNTPGAVLKAVEKLNKLLITNGICLHVVPGHEVRLNKQLIEGFAHQGILTLNDSRYMLLELPNTEIPKELDETVLELRTRGVVPIIAHPEWNPGFLRQPKRIMSLINQGALFQLTADSITGKFGLQIQKFSLQLCRNQWIHFIASDAHEPYYRNFGLEAAFRIIRNAVSCEYAESLNENARKVLMDELVEPWLPGEKGNKWYCFFINEHHTAV